MKLSHQIKTKSLTETPEEDVTGEEDQLKENSEYVVVVGVVAHEEVES